jgi:hypothetical protein
MTRPPIFSLPALPGATVRRAVPGVLACLAVVAWSSPLAGQSLLGATGLGFPLQATDARASSLGGIGVGLFGGHLLPTDPAAAADLSIPSLTFTVQNAWVTTEESGASGESSGARFPTLAASYPVRGVGVVSVGFGSVLDQRWELERQQTLVLAGTGTEARVTDVFESDGGVSAIRLGVARRVAPSLALGVQVGSHLGDLTRRFTRTFDSLEVETSVPPYQIGGFWRYRGLTATVGAQVDIGSVARVAASYTWSADLEAEASDDTDAGDGTFGMPSEVRLGGTATLAPRVSLSAGLHWADWARTRSVGSDVVGLATLALGGGLEWAGASVLGKPSALRVGYRRAELPFREAGGPGDSPSENILSAGLGMNLLQAGAITLASLDLALERGSRDAGSIEERFWRFSTSVRISGF